jgi:uncharacterized glyoxalase superfamily metalloenzyme YdcJ
LIEIGESQGGLTAAQGEIFVLEAIRTFRWQTVAGASREEYQMLKTEHPILADIVCFNTAHINHLTPRVLDIGLAEHRMKAAELNVKSSIEGPPARKIPILLRQTSFLALEEDIKFPTDDGELTAGSHTARFGEIEERGAALTSKGRSLYDEVLAKGIDARGIGGDQGYSSAFKAFPDQLDELLAEGLIFCTFKVVGSADTPGSVARGSDTVTSLMTKGKLIARPITYEDFLPFSAAGIFRSNLGDGHHQDGMPVSLPAGNRASLEQALGCSVLSSEKLYAAEQAKSLEDCARRLGLQEIRLACW